MKKQLFGLTILVLAGLIVWYFYTKMDTIPSETSEISIQTIEQQTMTTDVQISEDTTMPVQETEEIKTTDETAPTTTSDTTTTTVDIKTEATVQPTTVTNTTTTTATVTPKPVVKTIVIDDFSFGPASITIKKGTKITWINKDNAPHNVVASDKSFVSKTLDNGESYSFTFSKAGTYNYICSLHPMMKGTVVVE